MVFGDRIKASRPRRNMPLNDDPDALSDQEYAELLAAADAEPCPAAVPADEVAAALARLDDQEDYRNGK